MIHIRLRILSFLILLFGYPHAASTGGPRGEDLTLLRVVKPDYDPKTGLVGTGEFLHSVAVEAFDERHKLLVLATADARDPNSVNWVRAGAFLIVRGEDGWKKRWSKDLGTEHSLFGFGDFCEGPIRLSDREVALAVCAGESSDGEGTRKNLHLYRLVGGKVVEMYQASYTESSGSGYPSEHETLEIESVPSFEPGRYDLEIARSREACATEDDDTCEASSSFERLCWTGKDYLQEDSHCAVSKVTASSELPPPKSRADIDYEPGNVFDRLPGTAWVEGVKGPGKGQWLRIEIIGEARIKAVGILPGYGKSVDVWHDNNRVKKARLTFSNKKQKIVGLKDEDEMQWFEIAASAPVEWLKIEILDVYRGDRYNDTCISEVDLRGTWADWPRP
jgi:hypothetical protein